MRKNMAGTTTVTITNKIYFNKQQYNELKKYKQNIYRERQAAFSISERNTMAKYLCTVQSLTNPTSRSQTLQIKGIKIYQK